LSPKEPKSGKGVQKKIESADRPDTDPEIPDVEPSPGDSSLQKGDLRLFLLYLLSEGARHGYQLLKDIERKTGGAYRPSPGMLYPNLAALEEAGYVKAEEDEGRRVYYLTKAGQGVLRHKRRRVKEAVRRVEHRQLSPSERRRSRALAIELEEDLADFSRSVARRARHLGLDLDALRHIRRALERARSEVMEAIDELEETSGSQTSDGADA
jgi:DNA-binding PadR family transcriptional regulator